MKSLLLVAIAALGLPWWALPASATAQTVALEGNCAVCLVEGGKLMPGSKDHSVMFDRQVYYFPSEAEKKMFLSNPLKYAPVLGGDCVVCRANMGARVPGDAKYPAVHNNRLYLFPSEQELRVFKSDPRKYENVDLALDGHCSVCVVNAGKWVPGKPQHVSVYDGKRYYFPSADERQTFESDPAAFAPALEGDCVVCLKNGQKRVAGSVKFSALHDGRIYLFPEDAARQTFLANPATFVNVDLANDGHCVVCEQAGKKNIKGTSKVASVYKGQRYLFPSANERKMFDADPSKYVGQTNTSIDQSQQVHVVGKSACSGCSYGVRPLGDSNSLGMAVVANDKVYIVEDAERRFADLYASRYDGLKIELAGTIKKQEGQFIWVEPSKLERALR
ncbi:MAG TPA: hypothetical protein PKD64_17875 [Pirellulaceae bacterium]|nr:hypothetical protein [Pirellulaceae bacterium]HMO94058.1 hypothetical protein [Pirellulaceae bacterium]HMP70936.1 hypothetical protein [Pirellulaceae bacterium]